MPSTHTFGPKGAETPATKASFHITEGGTDITAEVDAAGVGGNGYTMAVTTPSSYEDQPLVVSLDTKDVTVQLGSDFGDLADVTVAPLTFQVVTEVGAAGNACEVVIVNSEPATDVSIDVDGSTDSTTLTIILGTDGDGLLDDTKNIWDFIKTAVNLSTHFTATGTASGSCGATEATASPYGFHGGGDNIGPDSAKNTPALIATAIDGLTGISGTSTGSDPITVYSTGGAFTGGADAIPGGFVWSLS